MHKLAMGCRQQSNLQVVPVANVNLNDNNEALPPGISVSRFDYSVDNHFKVMDKIAMISGESEFEYEESEIQRLCSSVTFLRKWRDFNYQPRAIKFACEDETSEKKDVTDQFNLPQFISAAVPKDMIDGDGISSPLSKDFVMNVGGHVWALDWCPIVHQNSNFDTNVEFIAVSAHPPESSYHKIGAPLTGRGLIQIWCVLNTGLKDQELTNSVKVKPKKYTQNNKTTEIKDNQPKKPIGRPRKNPVTKPVSNMDENSQFVQNLGGETSEKSNELLQLAVIEENHKTLGLCKPKKPRGRPRKNRVNESVFNMDENDEFIQNGAGQTSEKSNELLRIVVREETDKSSESREPKVHEFCDNSPKKSPKPIAITFPEVSDEMLDVDKITVLPPQNADGNNKNLLSLSERLNNHFQAVSNKRLEGEAIKVYSRKRKHANKEYSEKSTMTSPKSKLTKCQTREKSQVNHAAFADCENSLEQAPVDPEYLEKSTMTSSMSKLTKGQTRKKNRINYAVYADCGISLDQDPVDIEYSEESSKSKLKKCQTRKKSQGNSLEQDPEYSEKSTKSKLKKCQTWEKSQGNSVDQDPVVTEPVPEDVVLPKLVLGLAHNGKVAWDVKWKPLNSGVVSKHVMGYLAVLLGNGALEVWEIPLPSAIKAAYSSSQNEGTDPRFVKLKPVFRCSKLMCGDRQSIPLTLEWSTSAPHDLILAGCHDGVVAVWKFSENGPSKDTRPLLCFNGDTVPIRALKWAPPSHPESENVIVTAGHKGLKFWDIRDPFRPLRDVPLQKIIYSLEWLPDPNCVLLSSDDGEIKIISLSKAASDVPVTGMPNVKTQLHGLNSYYCSLSSIWSIQVSLTGMVAYCCSDGKVIHFQLTTKAVEKDPHRNRAPHYLCGSLIGGESNLTVLSCLPNVPYLMKKSSNEWSNAPRSKRGFKSTANQEKRAKDQKSQKLALGDKLGSSVIAHNNDSRAIVCIDDKKREEEKQGPTPKVVAMHRVRWNMNKGSHNLLCYGGAAGIIRCHLIT